MNTFNSDILVCKNCAGPLKASRLTGKLIHEETGMDNCPFSSEKADPVPLGVQFTYCEKYSRTVMYKTPHGMVKKTVQEAYA